MESRMGQAWARWSVLKGKETHRFAPELASLRCARPVVFPFLSKPGCLAQPPRQERLRALSADFRPAYPVYTQDRYRRCSAGQDDHPRRGFWV